MPKSELKTKVSDASVDEYLETVTDEKRRTDTQAVKDMMQRVTGHEPKLWGTSIIGFDRYHYKTVSRREGEWPITGVAARKQALTVYIMPGFGHYGDLLDKLGKYKTGSSCLYLGRLTSIDQKVLRQIIDKSVKHMRKKYKV